MPIPELEKFRQKYPQYNDLDDATIATKLANKYPDAYGDLLQKVSQQPPQEQPQEDVLQSLLGSVGKNVVGAGQETARKVGQLAKGAYYGVPKGVRQAALLPALPVADLYRTLKGEKNIQPLSSLGQMEQGISGLVDRIPQPQGTEEQLLQAMGGFVPFSQMVKPVQAGVRALPYAGRLPATIKSILTGASYGGGRAVLEGEPQQIMPEAISTAGQFGLWHGGGKLGATVGRAFGQGQLGQAIGSMVGSGAVGYATAPEGEREAGGIFGAGMGAISPSEPFKTQKMAEMTVKYMLKPNKSLYEHKANPERALVKEGLWGVNFDSIAKKAEIRNVELMEQIDIAKADNSNVRIDLSKNKALQPLYNLKIELEKDRETHKAALKVLDTNIADLKKTNVTDLNIYQAYDFINRIKRMTPSGKSIYDIPGGSEIKKALSKTYGNIREAINNSDITSNLKQLNKRVSDVIALKDAIDDASHRNAGMFRFIPIGVALGGFHYGNPAITALGIGAETLRHPAGATSISRLLGERYGRLPNPGQGGQPMGGLPPQPPQPTIPPSIPVNPTLPTTAKGETVNPMPTVPETIQKVVRKPRLSKKPTQPTEGKVGEWSIEKPKTEFYGQVSKEEQLVNYKETLKKEQEKLTTLRSSSSQFKQRQQIANTKQQIAQLEQEIKLSPTGEGQKRKEK